MLLMSSHNKITCRNNKNIYLDTLLSGAMKNVVVILQRLRSRHLIRQQASFIQILSKTLTAAIFIFHSINE